MGTTVERVPSSNEGCGYKGFRVHTSLLEEPKLVWCHIKIILCRKMCTYKGLALKHLRTGGGDTGRGQLKGSEAGIRKAEGTSQLLGLSGESLELV